MNDQPLATRVRHFVDQEVIPREQELAAPTPAAERFVEERPAVEELRTKARSAGLWNLYRGHGSDPPPSNLDYLPVAEETGRSRLAALIMNSAGPDSGNAELLDTYGTPEQQERWLEPLLTGDIRSCFAMTEPQVAGSDPRNLQTRIEVEDTQLRVTGRKWWITQAANPKCAVALVVGRLADRTGELASGHGLALVPLDTPGVRVVRRLSVLGYYEDHGELEFDGAVVGREALLGPEGDGLKIVQDRLVGARLHHCMRMVGLAERALQVMTARISGRVAFGTPLSEMGAVRDAIADCRVDIECMRGFVHEAARRADRDGLVAQTRYVSAVKVGIPRMATRVVDRAIQVCGGAGLADDLPLAELYTHARTLRIADGPDDVHKMVVAKHELRRQQEAHDV